MSTATVPTDTSVRRGRSHLLPRPSLEVAGLLTLLLGAWAGIVSYVGPTFGFSADGSTAWSWTFAHGMLFLLPGAGAFLAGVLTMMGAARDAKSVLGFAGLLAAACGAWLVVGPVAWPVLGHAAFFRTVPVGTRDLAYWIGYALGPGGLLLAFGAFILGRDRYLIAPPVTVGGFEP